MPTGTEVSGTANGALAGVSRKLERPLAIVIQSASAAGKTTLTDAVLSFFPEEERVKYSAMTGQSLDYLGQTNLKHKILAVVEEAAAGIAGPDPLGFSALVLAPAGVSRAACKDRPACLPLARLQSALGSLPSVALSSAGANEGDSQLPLEVRFPVSVSRGGL